MNSKVGSSKGLRMRFALVLVTAFAAVSAASIPVAAASDPAPGTGLVGACNMVRAGTGMFDIAMIHDNPQGNIGMSRAVAVSGCNP
jgi:hypothetical protein